jgi:hypothetical protein
MLEDNLPYCVTGNTKVIQFFDKFPMGALEIYGYLQLVSSSLSIFGSCFIIFMFLESKPDLNLFTLVFFLSVADLMASLSTVITNVFWILGRLQHFITLKPKRRISRLSFLYTSPPFAILFPYCQFFMATLHRALPPFSSLSSHHKEVPRYRMDTSIWRPGYSRSNRIRSQVTRNFVRKKKKSSIDIKKVNLRAIGTPSMKVLSHSICT